MQAHCHVEHHRPLRLRCRRVDRAVLRGRGIVRRIRGGIRRWRRGGRGGCGLLLFGEVGVSLCLTLKVVGLLTYFEVYVSCLGSGSWVGDLAIKLV